MKIEQGVEWVRNLFVSAICCVAAAQPVFAAGVTVIAHGGLINSDSNPQVNPGFTNLVYPSASPDRQRR